jgi:hypothetical protein
VRTVVSGVLRGVIRSMGIKTAKLQLFNDGVEQLVDAGSAGIEHIVRGLTV